MKRVALLVLIALVAAVMDPKVKWVSNTGNVYFLLFVGVIVISSVFAFMPTKSLEKINIIINWIILYFLMVSVVTTEKRLIIFMLMFLLINFKMSQHGFISYAQRGFGYAKWGLSGSPGWFQNAGDFGIRRRVRNRESRAPDQTARLLPHWPAGRHLTILGETRRRPGGRRFPDLPRPGRQRLRNR